MIALAFVAAALVASASPGADAPAKLPESRCMWLVKPEGGAVRSVAATGLNVLQQTALPGAFAPDRPADAQALQCGRASIVPAEHDDEVLALGMPLYIVEVTESGTGRMGALEISGGQYRYRLLEGNLTEVEAEAVTGRLNAFQDRSRQAMTPGQGGFEWRLNDESAPPDPAQASKDGFGVLMLITSDYEGFLKAWEGSTPPQVSTTEEVTRERPVHAMLLFSGCRAARDGNCNVTVELSIAGPNGSPYGTTLKSNVWSGPPAPGYNLQLSEASLGFILEPEDPLGTYTLKAVVTDNVAGTMLSVQRAVTAVIGVDVNQ